MQTASQSVCQGKDSNSGITPPVLGLPSNVRNKINHGSKAEQDKTEHLFRHNVFRGKAKSSQM